MSALYGWVENILFFLILMSLAETLLPSKAYGNYIRFFAGIVLILVAARPLLDGLQLEEVIRGNFGQFQFQAEAKELRQEILGIEKERLQRVMADYEAEAARQVEAMAREEGLKPSGVRVTIETDETKETYGTVVRVRMTVAAETEGGSGGETDTASEPVQGVEEIEPVSVKMEPIGASSDPAEETENGEAGSGDESVPQEAAQGQDGGKANGTGILQHPEPAGLAKLRRKVESYYGLESENVEIRLEER